MVRSMVHRGSTSLCLSHCSDGCWGLLPGACSMALYIALSQLALRCFFLQHRSCSWCGAWGGSVHASYGNPGACTGSAHDCCFILYHVCIRYSMPVSCLRCGSTQAGRCTAAGRCAAARCQLICRSSVHGHARGVLAGREFCCGWQALVSVGSCGGQGAGRCGWQYMNNCGTAVTCSNSPCVNAAQAALAVRYCHPAGTH